MFGNCVHDSNAHHSCGDDITPTMSIESVPVLGIFNGMSWLILLSCQEIART